MEALSLALDITLVGALALPWVMLVFHLFFTNGETSIPVLLRWIRKLNQPTAVAVVLFASAFFLGSIVSRMGQDFFNDDDLHLSDYDFGWNTDYHLVLRAGATENRIIAAVYCDHKDLLPASPSDPILAGQIRDFHMHDEMCDQVLRWISFLGRDRLERDEQDFTDSAASLFHLQEAALLIKATDATSRLQQLHYQVMVLRGAAFNGIIAFSLCLFSLGGRIRCGKCDKPWRWVGAVFSGFYIAVTLVAAIHHFHRPGNYDPPYMEFTLAVLSVSGVALFFMRPRQSNWKSKKKAKSPEALDPQMETPEKPPVDPQEAQWQQCKRWLVLTGVAGLLTIAAILGWWSTEQMYTEEVVYSYDALISTPQK